MGRTPSFAPLPSHSVTQQITAYIKRLTHGTHIRHGHFIYSRSFSLSVRLAGGTRRTLLECEPTSIPHPRLHKVNHVHNTNTAHAHRTQIRHGHICGRFLYLLGLTTLWDVTHQTLHPARSASTNETRIYNTAHTQGTYMLDNRRPFIAAFKKCQPEPAPAPGAPFWTKPTKLCAPASRK